MLSNQAPTAASCSLIHWNTAVPAMASTISSQYAIARPMAAASAMTPTTTQVTGLAHSAALNSQAAAVAIDQTAERPSHAVFARATATVTAPITPPMPSTASVTMPMARVMFGNMLVTD